MKNNDWKDRLNIVYSTNPDFKYDNGEEEEPGLENIEEDEEFDRVSAIFNEWLDTQDFGDIDLDALDDLED